MWMWMQLAFCTDILRPDYENYVVMYYNSHYKGLEVGYYLINNFLLYLNLDFDTANAVLMFITLNFIAIIIPKYTNNFNTVAALFMLYPLFISGIQIRFFIAGTIVLYGFKYLLTDKKIDVFKYMICCIIATTFHSSAIFYFLFIIPARIQGQKLIRISILLAISIYGALYALSGFLEVVFGSDRFADKVYNSDNTILQVVMAGMWQISIVIIMYLLKMILQKKYKYFQLSISDNLIYNISIFSIIIIPLYHSDFSMERLVRNLLPLQFSFFMNLLWIRKNSMDFLWIKICFISWFVLTYLIFNVVYFDRWNIITSKYLNCNDVIDNPQNHYILLSFIAIALSVYVFSKIRKLRII